jgi:hypothetical protein
VSLVFGTDDVPPESRARYWEQVLDDTLLPLRGRHDADFQARLVTGAVGAIQVAEATTPPGECCRPAKLIGSRNRALYEIDVLARGRVLVEQRGRQARLGQETSR